MNKKNVVTINAVFACVIVLYTCVFTGCGYRTPVEKHTGPVQLAWSSGDKAQFESADGHVFAAIVDRQTMPSLLDGTYLKDVVYVAGRHGEMQVLYMVKDLSKPLPKIVKPDNTVTVTYACGSCCGGCMATGYTGK